MNNERIESIKATEQGIYSKERFKNEKQFILNLYSSLKDRARAFFPSGIEYLNSPQKRAFDVLAAGVLFPLATPFAVIGALAIKTQDGGSIFYIQRREGKHGEEFGLIKLRTMIPDAESFDLKLASSFPKSPDDPRITKVGKRLRHWSIDEIPQLINVLKGELSFIGNRPPSYRQKDVFASLGATQDVYKNWESLFYLVKPGLVGLSIIKGRAKLDKDEWGVRRRMRYDMFYVNHASLCFDFWILKRSIRAVISGEGAW